MVRSPFRAASATFALKVGVWFRRGRLFMVSPDSLGTACPLSGRNSTYRLVQISETSSEWCEDHGVNVEYPDLPTGWKYGGGAGGTTLVVWKGNGERNRGFKGWLAKAEETDDPE